jgi:hypothetical protein
LDVIEYDLWISGCQRMQDFDYVETVTIKENL